MDDTIIIALTIATHIYTGILSNNTPKTICLKGVAATNRVFKTDDTIPIIELGVSCCNIVPSNILLIPHNIEIRIQVIPIDTKGAKLLLNKLIYRGELISAIDRIINPIIRLSKYIILIDFIF